MRLLPSLLAAVLRGEDESGFGKLVKNIQYKFAKSKIEQYGDLSYNKFLHTYRGYFTMIVFLFDLSEITPRKENWQRISRRLLRKSIEFTKESAFCKERARELEHRVVQKRHASQTSGIWIKLVPTL